MNERANTAKTKLIETAAILIHRQGWNATGINQILTESQVPKGSFYYYFHSKDELGAAIVRHNAQQLRESYQRTLLNAQLTGRAGLEAFFNEQRSIHRAQEWRYGCPVGSIANEVAATIEPIALACREAFNEATDAFAATLQRGANDRTLAFAGNAAQLGLAVHSAWQGALLYMKLFAREEPLISASDLILQNLK